MTERVGGSAKTVPVSHVMGTAGHIDHGKTELIKALTGIDTDRLKEEQERGISIDLGFAYLDLPNERRIGIIDVPGHERFIRAMVAGASGIDIVLFVIAADEGVMPQSVEHLDVCRFLGVSAGIIVLTKADLVSDEDVELALDDVRSFVSGTFLENAPVVLTSVKTGQGIEDLRREIMALVEAVPGRSASGVFRMPIDRSFTIRGFGTVVTGTVASGQVAVGSAVEVYPLEVRTKVRRIETHKVQVEEARAGQRTAINLPKVTKGEIRRGDVLSVPHRLRPAYVFDLHLVLNTNMKVEMKPATRVRFHVGTKEALGRVWPIGESRFTSGFDGFAQVRLEEPVVALLGDHFVIRTYSPAQVVGGGSILAASSRHRFRLGEELVEQLRMMKDGSPDEKVAVFVKSLFPQLPDLDEVSLQLGLSSDGAKQATDALCQEGILARLSTTPGRFLHKDDEEELLNMIITQLKNYHERYPLRAGMQERALASKFKHPVLVQFFDDVLKGLVASGKVVLQNGIVRLPSHVSSLSEHQKPVAGLIRERLSKAMTTPVEIGFILSEVRSKIGDSTDSDVREVINYLVESKEAVRVSPEFLLSSEGLKRAAKMLAGRLGKDRTMTVGECRDLLSSSRRFVVPLLEYLDSLGITRREGDVRRRGPSRLEELV